MPSRRALPTTMPRFIHAPEHMFGAFQKGMLETLDYLKLADIWYNDAGGDRNLTLLF